MTANYVLLEKITVGAAGASSVTFSGIPQTGYTDLVVKASARTSNASSSWLVVAPNGSTANLTTRRLEGFGPSGTGSGTTSTGFLGYLPAANYTANTFGTMDIYIPNYTSADYKSVSVDNAPENNSSSEWYVNMTALLWSNTAAITSLTFNAAAGNLVEGTTFYLYGVAKLGTTPAIVPYATGGDTIMTDGTYWYHTFVSSGTFTPQKAISCDYLVVAGGGGAGYALGGGGGAGGLRSTVTATGGGGSLETALSLASGTAYTVTIGAGGAGSTGGTPAGGSGSNSVFSTITSTGGGGGESTSGSVATSGGSGGGGSFPSRAGGAGTANQGYAGGTGSGAAYDEAGAGGGGAGAVGVNAVGNSVINLSVAGAGGAGVATSISGSSVTYAGGGGGGTRNASTIGAGGTGGGGRGANQGTDSQNGTANTGGGGGAGNNQSTYYGKNGGSGIVIVRYAV
jgi:hypothetical protein